MASLTISSRTMFTLLIWYKKKVTEPESEKVSEPVSKKFGTGKKSRNRYRKNLVPEKSLGTGIEKIWYRKFWGYFRSSTEISTDTLWYFWEDFRSSAETSTDTLWYFWEDFWSSAETNTNTLWYFMEDFRSSAKTSKARLNPLHGGRRGQKIAFLASAGWIIEILIFIAKILDSNIYDG